MKLQRVEDELYLLISFHKFYPNQEVIVQFLLISFYDFFPKSGSYCTVFRPTSLIITMKAPPHLIFTCIGFIFIKLQRKKTESHTTTPYNNNFESIYC